MARTTKKKMKMKKKKKQQQEASAPAPPAAMLKCPNCNYMMKIKDLDPHVKAGCVKSIGQARAAMIETTRSGKKKKIYICGECELIPESFCSQEGLSQHKAAKHNK